MPSFFKDKIIQLVWPRAGWSEAWTRTQFRTWVTNAGGRLIIDSVPHADITHFVCDRETLLTMKADCEALWAKQPTKPIHRVSLDWLKDSCLDKKKHKESDYAWDKQTIIKEVELLKKPSPDAEIENFFDVLAQGTAAHIHHRDQAEIDREVAAKIAEEDELKREELCRKQRAAVAASTARRTATRIHGSKSRNQVFAEQNHVYKDPTGLPYDILLAKVDILQGVHERIIITIYESNSFPRTYSTAGHLVGTSKHEPENVLSCLNAGFEVAVRQFKVMFKELTHLDWEKQRELGSFEMMEEEVELKDNPFVYKYPLVGPVGDLDGIADPDHLAFVRMIDCDC